MTREEYLKQLIIEDSGTLKDFAKKINMPYTTLYSISRNVGGASIDNILKICKVLGISADALAEMEGVEDTPKGYYTNKETAEFAEYLRTRPGARMLFSAAKDISKEDLEKAVEYIELLKLKNK